MLISRHTTWCQIEYKKGRREGSNSRLYGRGSSTRGLPTCHIAVHVIDLAAVFPPYAVYQQAISMLLYIKDYRALLTRNGPSKPTQASTLWLLGLLPGLVLG